MDRSTNVCNFFVKQFKNEYKLDCLHSIGPLSEQWNPEKQKQKNRENEKTKFKFFSCDMKLRVIDMKLRVYKDFFVHHL